MEKEIMIRCSATYIATPPGETLKEQLADKGLTTRQFASCLGMPKDHVDRLLQGDLLLTTAIAEKLERVLGIPASFWNNLEALYRDKLAKIDAETGRNRRQ